MQSDAPVLVVHPNCQPTNRPLPDNQSHSHAGGETDLGTEPLVPPDQQPIEQHEWAEDRSCEQPVRPFREYLEGRVAVPLAA